MESDDPQVLRLLSRTQVYLAWDWNPDGWNYVFDVDNNWRKNRRPNPDGSLGVDLNRNYPFGWDLSCGGSEDPGSNTFRGPSAGSEPEMQTMIAWQADRKFSKIVDLHSSGRGVPASRLGPPATVTVLGAPGILTAVNPDEKYFSCPRNARPIFLGHAFLGRRRAAELRGVRAAAGRARRDVHRRRVGGGRRHGLRSRALVLHRHASPWVVLSFRRPLIIFHP